MVAIWALVKAEKEVSLQANMTELGVYSSHRGNCVLPTYGLMLLGAWVFIFVKRDPNPLRSDELT